MLFFEFKIEKTVKICYSGKNNFEVVARSNFIFLLNYFFVV